MMRNSPSDQLLCLHNTHVVMHPLPEPIYVCIYKHSTFYYIVQHIARFAFKLKTKKQNKKKLKIKDATLNKLNSQPGSGKESSYRFHEDAHTLLLGLFIRENISLVLHQIKTMLKTV